MNNRTPAIKIYIAVLGIFVLLLSVGCGQKAAEKTAETMIEQSAAEQGKSADVTVDSDSKSFSMTVKDNDGQQQTMQVSASDAGTRMVVTDEEGAMTMTSGAEARLPEGFPKEVPIHESLKINTSLSDGASGFTLQCTSDEEIDTLVGYYQKACKESGWVEEMNMSQNPSSPMRILMYSKDDLTLNLIFQEMEGELHVTVGVSNE